MGGRANLQVVGEAIMAVRATGLITVGIRESGQLAGKTEKNSCPFVAVFSFSNRHHSCARFSLETVAGFRQVIAFRFDVPPKFLSSGLDNGISEGVDWGQSK